MCIKHLGIYYQALSKVGARKGIRPMEINNWPPYNQMSFWHLGTVHHSLSVVMRVWSFTDNVLVTLKVNDDEDYIWYEIRCSKNTLLVIPIKTFIYYIYTCLLNRLQHRSRLAVHSLSPNILHVFIYEILVVDPAIGVGGRVAPLPIIWRPPGRKFQTIQESLTSLACKHILL